MIVTKPPQILAYCPTCNTYTPHVLTPSGVYVCWCGCVAVMHDKEKA